MSIDSPDLSSDDARACTELVAALPDTLAGEPRRDVTPADAPGAAWGEEPIVLTCGVELPSAYDEFSSCSVIEDVGWFLPPEELSDPSADIVVTALTHSPRVSVLIPAAHRGSDAVQAELAPAIGETLTKGNPCF